MRIDISCPLLALRGNTPIFFNDENLNKPGIRKITFFLEDGEIPLLEIERIPSQKMFSAEVLGKRLDIERAIKINCPFGVVKKGTEILFNGENLNRIGVQRITLILSVGEIPQCIIDHIPVGP